VIANDWQFDIELCAYRMIAGGGYPDERRFYFRLDASNYKAKKTGIIYDIYVDSIRFRSIPLGFEKIYTINKYQWDSSPSDKYLMKFIHYTTDPYGFYVMEIPDNIDTLTLEFDAILKKGNLSTGHHIAGEFYADTIIADTSSPEIRKHIQLKLVRHETCSKYPFFVKYFN
jgi:hypothetical protein